MRYNGGKGRIAKHIVPIINQDRPGRVCWEPFCGGLHMTEMLKPDIASDIHPGLIALYEKLRAEPTWLDGFECTEDIYKFAKTLPDTDPAKAFIGFGCSFGGNWFRALAKPHPKVSGGRSQSVVSRARLLEKLTTISATQIYCGSFFDVAPAPGLLLYLDPPYRSTLGYAGVAAFNHEAFYRSCEAWAAAGSVVYVSEYDFPLGVKVWERTSHGTAGASAGGKGKELTERLYRLAL